MIRLPNYRILEDAARDLLDGYGDAELGEWTEEGPRAFHLRRRLNEEEKISVGEAMDLRNDPSAFARWIRIRNQIPQELWWMAYEEIPNLKKAEEKP